MAGIHSPRDLMRWGGAVLVAGGAVSIVTLWLVALAILASGTYLGVRDEAAAPGACEPYGDGRDS